MREQLPLTCLLSSASLTQAQAGSGCTCLTAIDICDPVTVACMWWVLLLTQQLPVAGQPLAA